jgi:hypothetical protein
MRNDIGKKGKWSSDLVANRMNSICLKKTLFSDEKR